MLQEDPVLFQLYKDLVMSQVISAEEFWANRFEGMNNREPAPYSNKQDVGISGDFLVITHILDQLSSPNVFSINSCPLKRLVFMFFRPTLDLRPMAVMV